ncbi:CPBP family intramembrane glutamic endopeptidase [Paenibacillus sp. 481]|uniref:CPBP family intramembrane glutamic endopeptidase n=1 Tax=Paenibacillus sp. 481 TaxID=2835869 RepID=UPI001E4163D7|nr:CPBP family intramembrane glutamic endopeptidase [Paenibacillus sp. 481]UHA73835.1 CPBP family intramembrane metalloprotease [Paenibacillus sp. 481]
MFSWIMISCLVLICVPGIVTMVAAQKSMEPELKSNTGLVFAINLVVIAVIVLLGHLASLKTGLTDPFFESIAMSGPLHVSSLVEQLRVGLVGGVICSGVFLIVYYGYLRHALDRTTVDVSERLRRSVGLWGRVLSGGVVEEVIFRYGLLNGTVWLGFVFFGEVSAVIVWSCIILSGIIFGLAHFPGNLAEGCKLTPLFIAYGILGNLWVTLICGWLFWQYGLIAAIVVHMLFHLCWYPIEVIVERRERAKSISS